MFVVIDEKLLNNINSVLRNMRNKVCNSCALFFGEVEFHMRSDFLEFVEQLFGRSSLNIMDFVHLVHFIVAREEREERKHLEENASDSPDIHFMVIVAVSQEALRRPVPPRRYILGERRLRVNSPAGTEIS